MLKTGVCTGADRTRGASYLLKNVLFAIPGKTNPAMGAVEYFFPKECGTPSQKNFKTDFPVPKHPFFVVIVVFFRCAASFLCGWPE